MHPEIKMNFLASPPLVVAYALAGRLDIDITTEPLGSGKDGKPVYLQGHLAERRRMWPTRCSASVDSAMFQNSYANVFTGDAHWQAHQDAGGQDLCLGWEVHLRQESALLRRHDHDARARWPTSRARARWRCSAIRSPPITSRRPATSPNPARRRKYLMAQGVQPADFNSYGARRGNHEVMMRGTFANIRLRNLLLPGTEGGVTLHISERRADVHLRRRDEIQGGRARR